MFGWQLINGLPSTIWSPQMSTNKISYGLNEQFLALLKTQIIQECVKLKTTKTVQIKSFWKHFAAPESFFLTEKSSSELDFETQKSHIRVHLKQWLSRW